MPLKRDANKFQCRFAASQSPELSLNSGTTLILRAAMPLFKHTHAAVPLCVLTWSHVAQGGGWSSLFCGSTEIVCPRLLCGGMDVLHA